MKQFIFSMIFLCFILVTNSQEKGLLTDLRDGKSYKTVKIGSQWIMAENFAFKPGSGNYWVYNNLKQNIDKYGYLYDWKTACSIAPKGWHLPTKEEWDKLSSFLGSDKQIVFNHILESGFNVVYGGKKTFDYFNINEFAFYWIATELPQNNAYYFLISSSAKTAYLFYPNPDLFTNSANCGHSVRFFKDNLFK